MSEIEQNCLASIADAIGEYLYVHLDPYACMAMNYLDKVLYVDKLEI